MRSCRQDREEGWHCLGGGHRRLPEDMKPRPSLGGGLEESNKWIRKGKWSKQREEQAQRCGVHDMSRNSGWIWSCVAEREAEGGDSRQAGGAG